MTIPDLSLGEWLMIAAASWAILSAVVAVPIGRAMRRADRDVEPATPFVDHEGTRYLEFYPPRVEATRATDADWLFAWPVDVLSDDEIGLRCEAQFPIKGGSVERGRINVCDPDADYSWLWYPLPDEARGPGVTTAVVWHA